jgi:Flp pilus assembly pilin Flp
MRKVWQGLLSKTGQTLVEYALILVLLVIILMSAVSVIGEKTGNSVGNAANAIR